MSDKIELHGWEDLILPTEALFGLSSRAFKLYGYTVWRARDKESAFPGQDRISQDLSTDAESWSLPTVKRAFAECVSKSWMYRERRLGTSSITHVFKRREDCEEFKLSVGSQAIRRGIAGDPTTDRGRSDKENKESKDNKDSKDITPAPKPPKKERDPNLDHPAFKTWDKYRESGGVNKLAANAEQRKAIVDAVGSETGDLEVWNCIVSQWLIKGYLLKNVTGLLDWFTGWKKTGYRPDAAPWIYPMNLTPKHDASPNKGTATQEQIEYHKRYLEQRKQQGDANGH